MSRNTEDDPRPRKKRRKRRVTVPRRMRWYVPPPSRDIDLMKPEYFTGAFCGCGSREENGVCWRCLNQDEDLFS